MARNTNPREQYWIDNPESFGSHHAPTCGGCGQALFYVTRYVPSPQWRPMAWGRCGNAYSTERLVSKLALAGTLKEVPGV